MPTTQILSATQLHTAATALQSGSLVAIPTETVYGLAGHARDPWAVASIFAAKERPAFDPLIVHIPPFEAGEARDPLRHLRDAGLIEVDGLSAELQAEIQTLLHHFWPGSLTCVLPRGESVLDLVAAGLPTVGIRMPAHPLAQQLLQMAGIPLAAPSANRFGRISPTTALAVLEELGGRIPYILDGGPCVVGVESTIIRPLEGATGPEIHLLRPGGIPLEVLQQATGIPIRRVITAEQPQAPGQLKSHYAPQHKLILLPQPLQQFTPQQILGYLTRIPVQGLGLLLMQGDPERVAQQWQEALGIPVVAVGLSRTGDPTEIAQELFAGLRQLDQSGVGLILADPSPTDTGLGFAIGDRLRRAASESPHLEQFPPHPLSPV